MEGFGWRGFGRGVRMERRGLGGGVWVEGFGWRGLGGGGGGGGGGERWRGLGGGSGWMRISERAIII